MNRWNEKGDVTLILALVMSLLAGVIGSGMLVTSAMQARGQNQRFNQESAFYAGELGALLSVTTGLPKNTPNIEDPYDTLDRTPASFNANTYTVGTPEDFSYTENFLPGGNKAIIQNYSGSNLVSGYNNAATSSYCGQLKVGNFPSTCLVAATGGTPPPPPVPPPPPNACPSYPNPASTVKMTAPKYWKTADRNYNQVMATPVAALMNPTDVYPTIVVPVYLTCTFNNNCLYTYENAGVPGYNNAQLWAMQYNGATYVKKWSWDAGGGNYPEGDLTAAIGNLGNDARYPQCNGQNSVVFVDSAANVQALNCDGTFRWKTTNAQPPFMPDPRSGDSPNPELVRGPVLADLSLPTIGMDGISEIIVGPTVYDSTGQNVQFRLQGFSNYTRSPQGEDTTPPYQESDVPNSATAPNVYTTIAYNMDQDAGHTLEIISSIGIHSGTDGTLLCSYNSSKSPTLYSLAAAVVHQTDTYATVVGVTLWCDGSNPSSNGCSPSTTEHLQGYHYSGVVGSVCVQDFDTNLGGGGRRSGGGAGLGVGGGSVNIANFDTDSDLEYGIATANYYGMFDTNGTLVWKNATDDYSSAQTGSTAFDLNGDGIAEIMYNDQVNFYIYDGPTGKVLYTLQNPSGTEYEYPIVIDADADGQAEIIAASNNTMNADINSSYPVNRNPGLMILDAPAGYTWVGTRKTWNQYAYFVTNVDDSGNIGPVGPTLNFTTFVNSIVGSWLGNLAVTPNNLYLMGFRNNLQETPSAPTCVNTTPSH